MAEAVEKVRSEPESLECVENLYINYFRRSNCYFPQYSATQLDGPHDGSQNTFSTTS